MNEFTVRLDLAKGKARQQQTVFVRQGDKNATTIVATITDHGAAAATSGLTARFQMRLPNGTEYYRKAASLSGNTATVTIDEAQAASVAGRTDVAYFQLLQGSTIVASTESFSIVVLPDALADAKVAESYDSAIQDAIDALGDAVEQLPSTVEDVLADHPEWTTTVQDGSITKAKLATDLARDRERLLYRLDNLLTATLPDGETATATDAAKTPVAGLALYGRSTQDGTPTPSAPVPIVSVAGVNLADPSEFVDGYLSTSGSITGITSSGMEKTTGFIPVDGSSFMSFVVSTDSDAGTPWVCIQWFDASREFLRQAVRGDVDVDYHDFYSVPSNAAYVRMSASWLRNGKSHCAVYADNVQLPYIPFGSACLLAIGRNIVNMAATYPYTRTDSGVTWTVNADGSVTANGTATANSWSHTGSNTGATMPVVTLAAGTYTTYAVGADGNVATSYRVRVQLADGTVPAYDNGVKTFTIEDDTTAMVCLVCNSGTVANNNIVRAMLWRGTIATAYQPYTYTVTPIDLDGHELRSLPDGTRDEVTVDERGHAVLVQRVGSVTLDGSESWHTDNGSYGRNFYVVAPDAARGSYNTRILLTCCPASQANYATKDTGYISNSGNLNLTVGTTLGISTVDDFKTWLAANPTTVVYPLATPVTIDLGYIDAVPLVGPDLTAQAIPTAPFALTYERDLNATLARLESAIATLA